MESDKISVVVPVYNIEKYIEKTVESICHQTYQNLEIILVNDGSTDCSGKIIDALSEVDNRIVAIHKNNGGVTSARIEGIKIATGDWIGFVDGDDFIEPKMYEILLNNALEHNADISHCGYQMVFPSRVDYYYNTKKKVIQNQRQGLFDLLNGDYVEPGLWNKLFKTDIVQRVINNSYIDESIKINEDLLMNYYFFKLSKQSVYYDICPYHYILRKGSAATSELNRNKLYDPIKVQKLILEDVKDNDKLTDIIYGRLATLYINGVSMKTSKNNEMIREYITMCKIELRKLKSHILNDKHGRVAKFKYRLCTFSPILYRGFHAVYSKARGTDNKYEVR